MKLKSIFKGGAYIVGIILLANLAEAFIPIPPKYNPFASTDWITLLWHSAVAILIAATTGFFTGLIAQFVYMVEDGQFNSDEKKKCYEYAYTAFFISLGILLAASLFGKNEFHTAMIFNGVIICLALLLVGLSKVFGKGIDQGGTASIGIHHHATQPPPQPSTQQPAGQQAAAQNDTPKVGMPGWAIALIIFFVLVILARIYGGHNQQNQPDVSIPPQPTYQQPNQAQHPAYQPPAPPPAPQTPAQSGQTGTGFLDDPNNLK